MATTAEIQLVQNYFPSETEMLPTAALERLAEGQLVDDIKVSGASQLDLGSVIALLKLAFDCIKFGREMLAIAKPEKAEAEKVESMIKQRYPQIAVELGDEELRRFANDLSALSASSPT